MEASTRKLIRPPLKELQEKLDASKRLPTKPPLKPPTAPPVAAKAAPPAAAAAAHPPQQQQQQPAPQQQGGAQKGPAAPPEQTNAENFYFAKQISMKTPMVVVLRDGEKVTGTVEWYDKHAFRLMREQASSIMIYKQNVKYMFKAAE